MLTGAVIKYYPTASAWNWWVIASLHVGKQEENDGKDSQQQSQISRSHKPYIYFCTSSHQKTNKNAADAKDLITKLLRRNPKTRLSTSAEIRAHRFFKRTDWAAVEKAHPPYENVPPFLPSESVVGEEDTAHFDATFTSLNAIDSIPNLSVEPSAAVDVARNDAPNPFHGFSYENMSFRPQWHQTKSLLGHIWVDGSIILCLFQTQCYPKFGYIRMCGQEKYERNCRLTENEKKNRSELGKIILYIRCSHASWLFWFCREAAIDCISMLSSLCSFFWL